MNWGKWIVVSFVLFAGFIATLVTLCVRQDISLVSKDYYKEELVYQARLEKANNTNTLVSKPVVSVVGSNLLQVSFTQFDIMEKGELVLFSSSHEERDRKFHLTRTDERVQAFDIGSMHKGMYRARLSWQMEGKEFYMEQIIHI